MREPTHFLHILTFFWVFFRLPEAQIIRNLRGYSENVVPRRVEDFIKEGGEGGRRMDGAWHFKIRGEKSGVTKFIVASRLLTQFLLERHPLRHRPKEDFSSDVTLLSFQRLHTVHGRRQ